ncbi:hypothetical protein ACOMHN_011010 [Nucella lapillus]
MAVTLRMSLIVVVVALWSSLQAVAAVGPAVFMDLDREWDIFKQVHRKVYATNSSQVHRRNIWEGNMKMIVEHNMHADRGLYTFRLGINHLGDMTPDEIVRTLNGFRTPAGVNMNITTRAVTKPFNGDLPNWVDWRAKGYVTRIKNQGPCGSCWAFSSTGALEGQHYRKTGRLMSLSEQNLIDCSFNEGNKGCMGGTMNTAFKFIHKNKGIDTEWSYPYQASNEKCRFRTSDVGTTCNSYVNVAPRGSERALQSAVASVGPISVAIDASLSTFHFYRSGVYYDPNCSAHWLDHGVLVVGYGRSAVGGQDYWLVKNSWGEHWGQQGYILMARNKGNSCGIASLASYPIV